MIRLALIVPPNLACRRTITDYPVEEIAAGARILCRHLGTSVRNFQ
jgi:hypothetical protein